MSNAMALTKPSTTANLCGAVKPIRKLILLGSKPRKANPALIHLNVQTAKVNIKLTLLTVHSGNIGSTRNSTPNNILKQNMQKKNLIMNTILELKVKYDIIFIQEPSWSTTQTIPNSRSYKGESLVGVVNYSNWLTFSRSLESESDHPRVVTYINIRLISLQFAL